MKPRLYLETTIPSYLTSRPSRDLIIAGHQQITRDWWENRRGDFQIYISQLVLDEAGAGDPAAARERLKVLRALPLLDITPEVAELTSGILASGKIPRKAGGASPRDWSILGENSSCRCRVFSLALNEFFRNCH